MESIFHIMHQSRALLRVEEIEMKAVLAIVRGHGSVDRVPGLEKQVRSLQFPANAIAALESRLMCRTSQIELLPQ